MFRNLTGAIIVAGCAVVCLVSCSDSNPTNSGGTGGGGGGATEFSSPTLGNGDSFQHVFTTAKSMTYFCSFHGTATSGMRATITVTAGGTPNLIQSNITTTALQTLNIDVGDTVRWTNQTIMQHNVRSAT